MIPYTCREDLLEDLESKRQCRLNAMTYRNEQPEGSPKYIRYNSRVNELTAEIEEIENELKKVN